MRFEQVMPAMREGKKVYNSNKPDDIYRMDDYGHLEIINNDFPDGCHSSISGDDIFSEDWEVIEDNRSHKESTVLFDEQEYYDGLFREQTDEPQSSHG